MGEVALLTRPFTFIVTLLASVDSVMTVLIARDLLARMGVGDASPLLALPSVMLGLGIIVGQALYGVLGARIGMRRLVGMWAVAMMLAAILTALSVAYGGFWAYCGAKFLLAIPIGLLYVLGYSMQRTATNAQDRAMASLAVKNTDTSAAAIGTVLGGYAAQMLGDEWVYVIVAFACVLLLLMAIYLMPRAVPLEKLCAAADAGEGAADDAGDAAGKSPSSVMRFCMSKRALALGLLVILPGTLAAGYASFLFPLFSVEAGLDKADINNIYVLGQIIVFLMIGALGKAEGHFGFQRVSTMGIASIAVVFLLFSFNTKLAWAIVVVALVGMGVKASYGWKGMWLDAAREAGVAPGPATGAMFTFYRLTLVVQPFVLAGLLSASDSLAVILLGLFCGLCAFLFWRSCRKRDGRG
jgi:predicted MFS family arabinose efflux permease